MTKRGKIIYEHLSNPKNIINYSLGKDDFD